MKTTFAAEFVAAAKQSPRLFFAPLIGAINAVRREARRLDRINKANNARSASDEDGKGKVPARKE